MKLPAIPLLFFLSLLSLFGCVKSDKSGYITEQGMVWNTQYHITYRGDHSLKDSILKVLDETGKSLSVFDPASLVSNVNQSDTTEVNNDFMRVYDMSVEINTLSDGAFDPTLSPLITAWGFGPGHKATSDTLKLDSLLRITGIGKTKLLGKTLIKEISGISFNFSAIAKGYGCDRVAEMLVRNGVKDYMVEIGGEITAAGVSPRGSKWNISIDRPVFSNDSVIHESQLIVSFTDGGLATSGNYRNYHENNGERYGHTISPVTGRPVRTDILSATVIASSAMKADALATAFMAMGSRRSKEIADSLQLPVLLIGDDFIWMSTEFKKLVK